jgi:hypothetical protein
MKPAASRSASNQRERLTMQSSFNSLSCCSCYDPRLQTSRGDVTMMPIVTNRCSCYDGRRPCLGHADVKPNGSAVASMGTTEGLHPHALEQSCTHRCMQRGRGVA